MHPKSSTIFCTMTSYKMRSR